MKKIEIASEEYGTFISKITEQDTQYKQIQKKEKYVDQQLKNLFDSI